ncbi:MAG TPA: hypothetical protein PKE12_00800 [Kiritimatiellia bacterium]|nr:hypothetical protein [Kiritimatiellia bacterium]
MRTFRLLLALAGVSIALLSVGCASPGVKHAYKGERQDPAELAVVLGTTQQTYNVFSPSRERITISRVDDRSTIPWYSPSAFPTAVYVQPGRRKLDIQYEHVHGVANGSVWVQAHTNRTYQIKVMNPEKRTQRVFFVIEDITAQTLVGGLENAPDAGGAPPVEAPAAE